MSGIINNNLSFNSYNNLCPSSEDAREIFLGLGKNSCILDHMKSSLPFNPSNPKKKAIEILEKYLTEKIMQLQ